MKMERMSSVFLVVFLAIIRSSCGAPVVWEMFLDPLCRSCKSGWPALTQVAERYAHTGDSSLTIVVHPFPAP